MKNFRFYAIAGSLLFSFSSLPLQAAYTIKDGKLLHTTELATLSVQEHYSAALEAYQKEKWEELVLQATIVIKNFSDTPFAADARYYLGIGYFHMQEYEQANKQLSNYLKNQTAPKYFEEAIKCKFSIAERYQKGAKKHLLGLDSMPKWLPAREEAIDIYDEVITALPHHELAVQALYGKAQLLLKDDDYKASVETYQTLIRKFNKHPLSCESYIGISEVYLTQCKQEYPDPDFLDLAEINLRKFKQDFPNEPRVAVAEKMVLQMQEIYADNLYETARFYERTKKQRASMIYYNKIVLKYPQTKVAQLSQKRLDELERKHQKEQAKLTPPVSNTPGMLVSNEEHASPIVLEGAAASGDAQPQDVAVGEPEVQQHQKSEDPSSTEETSLPHAKDSP